MFRKILIINIFCLSALIAFSQSEKDSLLQIIQTTDHDSTKVFAFLQLYDFYLRSDQSKALQYTLKAESLSKQSNLPYCLAYSKYCKGIIYGYLDRHTEAKATLDSALIIFEAHGHQGMVIDVKYELADLMQIQSRLQAATNAFLEILPSVQALEDKNQEARIHNSLGIIYEKQKQYDKALEHFQFALELVTLLDIKPGISACLMNIGQVLLKTDKVDAALSYMQKSLAVKIETGDKLGASIVLGGIGNVFLESGSYDSAHTYYQNALKFAKDVGDTREVANTELGLAEIALLTGNPNRSLDLAQPLITKINEFNDPEFSVNLYSILARTHAQLQNAEKAYEYLELQMRYADSLYNSKILSVTNNLEAKYQNEQKSKEIELLQSENRLKELQIKNRLIERNYLIAFVIGIIVLLGLVYNQYRINRKSANRLRELDRFKSDFYTNISHEFRTPLSLLMAPLKEKIDSSLTNESRQEYQRMYRNAEQLFNLINELLDLSKLETGKMELNLAPTLPEDFLRLISASFESLAEHKDIQYLFEFDGSKDPVLLDQQLLLKVCNNLLSNAFKFTPRGGEITFSVNSQPGSLHISIADTAGGFTKEESDKIFDRFFQSPQHQKGGFGIGLALTQELTKLHNGTLQVKSEEGLGSVFKISIPVELAEEVPVVEADLPINSIIPQDREPNENVVLDNNKQTILIIEDNHDLNDYLKSILEKEYHTLTSSDGLDGVATAKEFIPDLVISDVMMPHKSGIEVCNELKELTETDHIPIILLTAKADQASKLEGLSTGADDYIQKPFDSKELLVRVSNLLTQREKLKEKFTRKLKLQPAELEISNPEEVFLKRIMEIIEEHLSDSEFTAEKFGEEIGLSRMQLHRKLTALTGLSATNFIRQQRLTRASQMLMAGENVSQVAYAVGFGSLSYFTRSFKNHFGVTPSEYRSQYISKSSQDKSTI